MSPLDVQVSSDAQPSMSTDAPPTELVSNQESVGLANPGLSQSRRQMLDLVNRLHNTGVQIDIDIPQIAVIGSQSAGKSSLIESISGITLPRAAGTCTRCPTECRLSRSTGTWKCVVSLRRLTDARGQTLGQVCNELFGQTIYNRNEVEERIRRAQQAILNPSKPVHYYLEDRIYDSAEAELSFSMNCVSLQITGPDVADLSFCDLPGLIASVGRGGDENDIKLVESLVVSYIKKPSCIILLTVACETDFENQGAHTLAKAHDPEGKRTIGVLTKPDRIPKGEENRWLPYIYNEKEPLVNNWYCVKQPSSNDLSLGITWGQARKREEEYFATTSPWGEIDASYQKYLRTFNLVQRLSSILSDLIATRLPEIQDELERAVIKAADAIEELPKAPSSDPHNEVLNLLHEFTFDLSKNIGGIPDEMGILQLVRPEQEIFRQTIMKTAPVFSPFSQKDGRKRLPKMTFLLNEEDIQHHSRFHYSKKENPAVLPNEPSTKHTIYVEDVSERTLIARTRELPGHYPFVVQESFIKEFLKGWEYPAHKLCRQVFSIMSDYVKILVTRHFAHFGEGDLERQVKTILQDHIRTCFSRAEERVKWLLDIENLPFSLNAHYLADYKDKFFTHYKGLRLGQQNPVLAHALNKSAPQQLHGGEINIPDDIIDEADLLLGVKKVLTGLTEIGVQDITVKDIFRILPPDEMDPALNIMADVRAYFQVAYKRFADNVPLAIDHELVRGIQVDIHKILCTRLGVNGTEGRRICEEFAREDPHVADRREQLVKKAERLKIAYDQLLGVRL